MKLEGPVYTIDRQHHYNEILKEVSGIQKTLVGPVFKIDRKHGYAEVPDVVPKVGDLAGMIGINIVAGFIKTILINCKLLIVLLYL